MKRKFKIQVNRYYSVTDTIEVKAISKEEARELADMESGNKDYTGNLSLDEVTTEVLSENRTFIVKDIDYDTDGEDISLPKTLTIVVPSNVEDDEIDEYLSDEISNITGFCHKGFKIEGE